MRHYLKSSLLSLTLIVFTSQMGISAEDNIEIEFNTFGNLGDLNFKSFLSDNPNIIITGDNNDWGTHHNSLFHHLLLGDDWGDLIVADNSTLGKIINRVDALDLNSLNIKGISDIPDSIKIKGTSLNNELHAIPLTIGVSTLFYRDDVLSQMNKNINNVISDWDSFIEFGRELKNDDIYLINNAHNIIPVIVESNLGDNQYLYFNNQLQLDLKNSRIIKAFELANLIYEEGLSAETGIWNQTWYNSFSNTTANVFSEINGEWLKDHLTDWIAPDNSGVWKLSTLPEQNAGMFGGYSLIIPSTTNHPNEVANLVNYIFTEESILKRFKDFDFFPANTLVYSNESFESEFEYFGNQMIYQTIIKNSENLSEFQSTPYDYFITDKLNLAFQKVKNDEMSINEALSEVETLTKTFINQTQNQAGE